MYWERYVSMAERREQAKKAMQKLTKRGILIEPVELQGRTIAHNFWGRRWCNHIESLADYKSRLDRGIRYVRNGSVCHLAIRQGAIEAYVSGSELYRVSVQITTLSDALWQEVKKQCSGQIGSVLELLQGKVSDRVMEVITHAHHGLFPEAKEIAFSCSCPDEAQMCKHVAAVLYGIGSRLDQQPELLFKLRGVDASELISTQINTESAAATTQLTQDELSDIFGIELDMDSSST